MPLDLQYDIVNDTPASAGPVEANFNRVEQYINQELIARDGHVAMTGQLRLVGTPVADLDAAPKNYVDAVLPVGIVMSYGGGVVPPGGKWLLCDGASYASADYPELFAVISTTFGGSGGSFNVPNMGGKMALGANSTYAAGSTGGTADSVGVGPHTHAIDHTHAAATTGVQSADHSHTGPLHSHKFPHTHGINNHRHQILPNQGSSLLRSETPGGGNQLTAPAGTNTMNFSTVTGDPDVALGTNTQNTTDTADAGTGSSGGISANHTHTVSVPALAQQSGGASVAATNGNLPPYIGLTQIIRAK